MMRDRRTIDVEETYTIGTLIVEMRDAERDVVVWRATGSSYLSKKPENNVKKLDKIVEKFARRWNNLYSP